MRITPRTKDELARLLMVDEVATIGALGPDLVLAVRAGDVVERVTVELSGFRAFDVDSMLKVLRESARRVRTVAARDRVLRESIKLEPIRSPDTPGLDAWMDYQTRIVAQEFGMSKTELGLVEAPKLIDRFAAIVQEMEMFK